MKMLKYFFLFKLIIIFNIVFANDGSDKNAEGQYGSKINKTSYISGVNFTNRIVQYSDYDGLAFFEGDILLGTSEDLEKVRTLVETQINLSSLNSSDMKLSFADKNAIKRVLNMKPYGIGISDRIKRWPGGVVHYSLPIDFPDRGRVLNAIQHWEEKTKIRFKKRTDQTNFIVFDNSRSGCYSRVGMTGKAQVINLDMGCKLGNVIHEIGHAIGLWHEQSREDRDQFITININNVKLDDRNNFFQHISDGDDIGAYDYGSIMHYSQNAFAIDSSKPTIIPKKENVGIGQRLALSSGDIAAVEAMYR